MTDKELRYQLKEGLAGVAQRKGISMAKILETSRDYLLQQYGMYVCPELRRVVLDRISRMDS